MSELEKLARDLRALGNSSGAQVRQLHQAGERARKRAVAAVDPGIAASQNLALQLEEVHRLTETARGHLREFDQGANAFATRLIRGSGGGSTAAGGGAAAADGAATGSASSRAAASASPIDAGAASASNANAGRGQMCHATTNPPSFAAPPSAQAHLPADPSDAELPLWERIAKITLFSADCTSLANFAPAVAKALEPFKFIAEPALNLASGLSFGWAMKDLVTAHDPHSILSAGGSAVLGLIGLVSGLGAMTLLPPAGVAVAVAQVAIGLTELTHQGEPWTKTATEFTTKIFERAKEAYQDAGQH